MSKAEITASTARPQNDPRHPKYWEANAPSGTPSTVASMTPALIIPNARDAMPGPALLAATTQAMAQKAPVASAAMKRANINRVKSDPSATTTWPTAKTAKAKIRVSR